MAPRFDAQGADINNHHGNFMIDTTINLGHDGRVVVGGGTAESSGGGDADTATLASLPYAHGAEFNANRRYDAELDDDYALQHDTLCYAGTRVALLAEIMEWTTSTADDARHVFWLSGLAGTGKSTVARTVARRCADERRLGGSFFFARGGGDRASGRKFVTTLALQLAAAVPALKPHVAAAVRSVRAPSVGAMALRDQWAQLVLKPLAKLGNGVESNGGGGVHGSSSKNSARRGQRRPIVFVIDALDECDTDSETGEILGLLALGASEKPSLLRVLLTSRPETSIRYGIQSIPPASLARLALHHIAPSVVDNDISIYLAKNLCRIGTAFLRDPHWPDPETLSQLVKQAGGLFIWASTAYRYIFRGGAFAKDRLRDILSGTNDESTPERSLDRIYLTVLDRAVGGTLKQREKVELSVAIHALLATVAVMAAPLDEVSLASLAGTTSDAMNKAFHGLYSILNIPDHPSLPIRLLHSSFRDFVVDPYRCVDVRFLVDREDQHQILAERCLDLMVQHLCKDICGFRAPGIHLSQIDRDHVERSLSPSLQYACCYWGHHIQQAGEGFLSWDRVLAFLNERLLHWLESLSLLERLQEAVYVLQWVELHTSQRPHLELCALAYDARRFVTSNFRTIAKAPLQVYCSALVFAPSRSLVRRQFLRELSPWISCLPELQHEWNQDELQVEASSLASTSDVGGLMFLHGGQGLLSRGDYIELWNVTTGARCGSIGKPSRLRRPTAQSHDGRFIAYMQPKGAGPLLCVWDVRLRAERGVCILPPGTLWWDRNLAFSPDGRILAAALEGGVLLCNTSTMDVRSFINANVYNGDDYDATLLSFSFDGQLLALAASGSICIWDVRESKIVLNYKLRRGDILAGRFSPVESLLVVGSDGHNIQVVQKMNHNPQIIYIDHPAQVVDMVFYPDGKLLASASRDECVIWDIHTRGRLFSVKTLRYSAPAISPDGRFFACNTNYGIQVFQSGSWKLHSTLTAGTSAQAMAFSPDSRLFAWTLGSGMISIRDVKRMSTTVPRRDVNSCITRFVCSVDGHVLATLSVNGSVRVYSRHGSGFHYRYTSKSKVRKFVLSGDGSRLAYRSGDGATLSIKIPGGRRLFTVNDQILVTAEFMSWETDPLGLSYDGQLFATTTKERGILCYNFRLATSFRLLIDDNIVSLAFTDDRPFLAGASQKRIYLCDVHDRALVRSFNVEFIKSLAFSPDGRFLAAYKAMSHKKNISILDLATGATVTELMHPRSIETLSFSEDGRQLRTNRGALFMSRDMDDLNGPEESALAHLYIRDQWVSYATCDILWLPPDYRPPRSIMSGNVLTFEGRDGNLTFLEFDLSKLADAGPTALLEPGSFVWKRPERQSMSPSPGLGTSLQNPKPRRMGLIEKWRSLLQHMGFWFWGQN